MTNETKCGIINEFANEPDGSHRAQERTTTTEKFEKSFSKKFEKRLDKLPKMWYNDKVAGERNTRKKLRKTGLRILDKFRVEWIPTGWEAGRTYC